MAHHAECNRKSNLYSDIVNHVIGYRKSNY